MNYITKVILIVSIGFIIMGITYLKNEKIKKALRECGLYKDANGFIKVNGILNISIGVIGILIAISNYFFSEFSRNFLMIFAVLIIISLFIQKIYCKRYK